MIKIYLTAKRAFSVNIKALRVKIVNEDVIISIFFLIVRTNMECLSISGMLDLMKHSTAGVMGIVRGPGED